MTERTPAVGLPSSAASVSKSARRAEPGTGLTVTGISTRGQYSPETLLALQRTVGNAGVLALLSRMDAQSAPGGDPPVIRPLICQVSGHGLADPQQHALSALSVQREDLADDPYPATEDGEQPALISISDEGLDFIIAREGSRNKLYNDSVGHCTIGVGHLVHKGPCNGSEPENFKKGLTDDEVKELFTQDIGVYESGVSAAITSRINQYEFDALVSFAFNIGLGAFRGSGVLKKVNKKKYSEVPAEMMKWVKPASLRGRRTKEATLFRTGQY